MYSIDTSSIIDAWYFYPPDTFKRLWEDHLPSAIDAAALKASEAVQGEIKQPDIKAWCKDHSGLFVPPNEPVQIIVTELMATYGNIEKPNKAINGADPFVIGLAETEGLVVITEEHPGSQENPKIPYVCKQRDIETTTFLKFVQAQGWTY